MRLAWPLNKDDTQIREGFHNFKKVISFYDLFKDTFAYLQVSEIFSYIFF